MAESVAMDEQDKKWQAENDARCLKEAEMIKADSARHEAALKLINAEMDAMHQVMADKMFPSMKKEK